MRVELFDFSINVLRSLLWRHNNAENLQALVTDKQTASDDLNNDFWVAWIVDVFCIDTANAFGLSVWSRILEVPLTIEPEGDEPPNSNWGFGEFRQNFNNGNFTRYGGLSTLPIGDARKVLKLRYYQMVTRATTTEINKIMADVFGDAYVLDNLDMTMTYIFPDYIGSAMQSFVDTFDILPRPSAVELNIVTKPNKFWGFGQFRKNFNSGNFRR